MKNSQNSYKNPSIKMRQLILIGLSVLFVAQVSAQTSPINFSGNWSLNESKSKFGDGPFRWAATTLVVKQEANTLSIDRIMPGFDGEEIKMTGKYTLDGKVCENSGMMEMKIKSTVTWSADKKSFTLASSYPSDQLHLGFWSAQRMMRIRV